LIAHPPDRVGQPAGVLGRLLQQMKRESLRGFASDPREPCQLRHEIFNG